MSITPGSSLLMAIAVAEAQLTESTYLDPEHIFLALLKAEDISAEKVEGMPPPLLEAAIEEIQMLCCKHEIDMVNYTANGREFLTSQNLALGTVFLFCERKSPKPARLEYSKHEPTRESLRQNCQDRLSLDPESITKIFSSQESTPF